MSIVSMFIQGGWTVVETLPEKTTIDDSDRRRIQSHKTSVIVYLSISSVFGNRAAFRAASSYCRG